MKRIILFTLLLVVSFSCTKGKADFILKGTISNTTYGISLDGAAVYLYEYPAGGGASTLLSSTTTNGVGEYSFSFPRNQAESYTLVCEKQNYFSINESINFSDLSIEDDNVRNYATTAKSWAKLRFVNQSPLPTDVLKYTKTQGKDNCEICCPSGEVSLVGIVDTTIYCANDGNTSYTYTYIVQGTSIFGEKTAVTTAFDTVEILLNY